MKTKALMFALCATLAFGCQRLETPTDPTPASDSLRVATTGQSNDMDHVTGHADIESQPFDLTVVDSYSFSAIQHKDGRVSGQFQFRARRLGPASGDDAAVRVHGRVDCVTVEGNKARMGGTVTNSSFEGIPEGSTLTWSITDGGSPGRRDTASQLLGAPTEPFCAQGLPYTYPEFALRRGNVQIH